MNHDRNTSERFYSLDVLRGNAVKRLDADIFLSSLRMRKLSILF